MINSDNLKVKGNLELRIFNDQTGKDNTYKFTNLVVFSGKTFIASRMIGEDDTVMSLMGVGSDASMPISSDTQLYAQINPRQPLTQISRLNNVVTYKAVFPNGQNEGELREAAVFNDDGIMLCRTTFGVVTKGMGDTVEITWNITVE